MALRQTAHEVDLRQPSAPREDKSSFAAGSRENERILIHVTDSPSAVGLIRRGRRVADYLRADCFAVAVVPGPGLSALPIEQRDALERHLDFARKLHIDTRVLDAENAPMLSSVLRTPMGSRKSSSRSRPSLDFASSARSACSPCR